jgi:phage tail sheath protein FI
MPEYLAPGVFVEEESFRSKSIEGVSTTTTGFIGPARFGPVSLEPDIVTSLEQYEEVYGDGQPLDFKDSADTPNFLRHAVWAFFAEGGKRLYISRVFRPLNGDYAPIDAKNELVTASSTGSGEGLRYDDGHARVRSRTGAVAIRARHPGAIGNWGLKLTLRGGPNVLRSSVNPVTGSPINTVSSVKNRDLVWIRNATSPASPSSNGAFYIAQWKEDSAEWQFESETGSALPLQGLHVSAVPGEGDSVRVVTLAVSLMRRDGVTEINTWSDLPLDPLHRDGPAGDSVFDFFANAPGSARNARTLPLVIARSPDIADGLHVLSELFDDATDLLEPTEEDNRRNITAADKLVAGVSAPTLRLEGGNDGQRPGATEYEGDADPKKNYSSGLKQFEDIEDISIVAAPGVTWRYDSFRNEANSIIGLLIGHAEHMRYRIAVLDSAENQTISEVRGMRGKIDSKHAALYYPWVTVQDPITRREMNLPPSGFVAGIYARNDNDRAVYKAPANEVARLAIGFETLLNKAQQEVLNPEGINCFRFFEGRGFRLWGARTISSDPEWKYVNVRRYFAYLERSVDKGTQWAVFEPNGEQLWANVRRTIEDFLLNEWQNGALLGEKPDKAFFVRCDRSIMTQNDLDNGRLICLIGVAVLKPAEFVVFRVGQWTADRKV